MATLRASWSWASHTAVPATPRSARPIRAVVPVHPLGWRGPSPAAPVRIQARTRDFFRFRCQKGADHQPEPEPELDDYNSDVMTSIGVPFVDLVPANSDDPFIQKLRKYHEAFSAAAGMRVPPDMFRNERDEITSHMMKISSSRVEIQNVNNKVMALNVCAQAQTALDLASMVMDLTDVASLDLGPTEFSPHTANQMVMMYTPIFRNVAEDAYRKRIKMDTVISFLDALRGLCTICNIVVQDTVAMLVDSAEKKRITEDMESHTHEYYKKVNNLKEEFMMAAGVEHTVVMEVLFDGIKQTQSYIFQLVQHRRGALAILQGEKAKKLMDAENAKKTTGHRVFFVSNSQDTSCPRPSTHCVLHLGITMLNLVSYS